MISARIALRLALGILCGVVLVTLPAVFSSGITAAPAITSYTSRNGTIFGPAIAAPLGLSRNSGVDLFAFLSIILLIFLPSTVCSLLVRRWVEKRAREYL